LCAVDERRVLLISTDGEEARSKSEVDTGFIHCLHKLLGIETVVSLSTPFPVAPFLLPASFLTPSTTTTIPPRRATSGAETTTQRESRSRTQLASRDQARPRSRSQSRRRSTNAKEMADYSRGRRRGSSCERAHDECGGGCGVPPH